MRKLWLLFLLAVPAFPQANNVRWDWTASTVTGTGQMLPMLALPGAYVNFYANCTALPCTTPAATFISQTSTTQCSSTAQVTWQATTVTGCQSKADSQGNFGGWFLPGTYQYVVTVSGHQSGPYNFSVGGGGGGGGSGTVTAVLSDNFPPYENVSISTPTTTPTFHFTPIPKTAHSLLGVPGNATANPDFFNFVCSGIFSCGYDSGTNTETFSVPIPIRINSVDSAIPTNFNNLTPAAPSGSQNCTWQTDGSGNVSCYVDLGAGPLLRMNPGEDSTHVFVPFTQCAFSADNPSLVVPGSTCDAVSGLVDIYAGGIFNHNVNATMTWSLPSLPSWLPAVDVVSVQIAAYSSGWSGSTSSTCGGSGGCSAWTFPPSTGQKLTNVTGVTGATLGSLTASATLSQSTYTGLSPFTIIAETNVPQIGLLIEYTGVTNPSPSQDLNIAWPLQYTHLTNTLGTFPQTPTNLTGITVAELPNPVPVFRPTAYLVNDLTSTSGTCTGGGGIVGWCVNLSTVWTAYPFSSAGGGTTTNPLTMNNSGSGDASGSTFDGSAAKTISYNTVGAPGIAAPLTTGNCIEAASANTIQDTGSPCGSGGGGGVGGSGTSGFIPLWNTSTDLADSPLDYNVTLASFVTSSKPIQVVCSTCSVQIDMTYNSGHPLVPTAGAAGIGVDSSENLIGYDNGGAAARICTATNGQCPGGAVSVNGSTVASANFNGTTPAAGSNGKNVAFQVSSSNVSAEIVGDGNATHYLDGTGAYSTPAGGGGGYTNVTGSSSQTTVAAINSACGSGTFYATTALSIATGGTLTCSVQFSKAGLWTIASGQTVTFASLVTETDGPNQHFAGSGTVAFSWTNGGNAQIAPVEWFGAKGDNSTDNSAAIQACINASPLDCHLSSGKYKFGSTLTFGSLGGSFARTGMTGVGATNNATQTRLIFTHAIGTDAIHIYGSTGAPYVGATFADFELDNGVNATSASVGLDVQNTQDVIFNRVQCNDFSDCLSLKNFGRIHYGEIDNFLAGYGFVNGTTGYTTQTLCGVKIDTSSGTGNPSLYINGSEMATNSIGDVNASGVCITGSHNTDLFLNQFSTSFAGIGISATSTGGGGFHQFDIHLNNSILDQNYVSCMKFSGFALGDTSTVQADKAMCVVNSGTSGTGVANVDVESSNGIQVMGLEIANPTGVNVPALYANGSSHISFLNNIVRLNNGATGNCVKFNATTNSQAHGNDCYSTTSDAILLQGTSTGNDVGDNIVDGTGVGVHFAASVDTGNFARSESWGTGLSAKVSDSGTANTWNDGTTEHLTTNVSLVGASSNTFVKADGTGAGSYSGSSPIVVTGTVISCPTCGTSGNATPATIPNLAFWFSADRNLCTNGSQFQKWYDTSTASFANVSASTGGTCATAVLNGNPGVTMNGNSTSNFTIGDPIWLPFSTIFVVAKTTGSNGVMLGGSSTALELDMSTTNINLTQAATAVIGTSSATIVSGTWYQFNSTYDSTSGAYAFRVARATAGSGTNAKSIAQPTSLLGCNPALSTCFAGQIAEIIVYNRVLTGTEITTIETYLNTKYGI